MATIDWLKQRKETAPRRADVIVLHSTEGGGKTSWAAEFNSPTFAMSENETGLLTLMSKGLVPACAYFPEFQTWGEVVECTAQMVASSDAPRTLVIDTLNGIESLLFAHVCDTQYEGEMGKKGFLAFQEGPRAAVPIWREWLGKLDALRSHGTTVVLLCHSAVVNFKNPTGADYSRYVAEMHDVTWSATKKFADMVVFCEFHTEVGDVTAMGAKRGKGRGGRTRVYHFERSAAFDAKHRHGLPASMTGTGSARGDYEAFVELVKAGIVQPATDAEPAK